MKLFYTIIFLSSLAFSAFAREQAVLARSPVTGHVVTEPFDARRNNMFQQRP
jgi:hypothetical protein